MKSQDIFLSLRQAGQWVLAWTRSFIAWMTDKWQRLTLATENYLKSRTKNFPTSPPQPRKKVVELLGRDPLFLEETSKFTRATGFGSDEVQAKAKGYLREIASDLNYLTTVFWEFALTWVFNKLYDGISVDEASLVGLRAKVGKTPIVFIPNHRSHMDYLLLSYVFYHYRLPLPYVCAGNNMNFWPAGILFRKSGAFYIRRRFEGNRLYQAALYTYLHYLLKEKALLEFFIEGTRSRTGKLLPPRYGILSLLVKAFREPGDIPDVLLVPTSLVYESIIEEGHYVSEQEGGSKKQESVLDLFRLGKHLRRQYGKVYLRFDEPISLKSFTEEQGTLPDETMVPLLASRISYAINKSTVVTPGALVAMAVLMEAHPSIPEGEIEARFGRCLDYLEYKEAPLSALMNLKSRGQSLHTTVDKYVRGHLLIRYQDEEGIFYQIAPGKRKNLDYYKNTGVHFFISAAAVATIFLSRNKKWVTTGEIETEFAFLKELFLYEFSFSRRKSLSEHVAAVLNYLQTKRAIVANAELTQYQIGPEPVWLEDFSALLQGPLAMYWGILKVLAKMPARKWEGRLLADAVQKRVRIGLLRHNWLHHEALSSFLIRNALQSYDKFGIVKAEKKTGLKKTLTFYVTGCDVEKTSTTLNAIEQLLPFTQTKTAGDYFLGNLQVGIEDRAQAQG